MNKITIYLNNKNIKIVNNQESFIEPSFYYDSENHKINPIKDGKIIDYENMYKLLEIVFKKNKIHFKNKQQVFVVVNSFINNIDKTIIKKIFYLLGFEKIIIIKEEKLIPLISSEFSCLIIKKNYVELFQFKRKHLIQKKHYDLNNLLKNSYEKKIKLLLKHFIKNGIFNKTNILLISDNKLKELSIKLEYLIKKPVYYYPNFYKK